MEPFFFDSEGQALFGCYHEPRSGARDCAVLLANPVGHEYVQFHRVYRQLAIMLSDAGFPVLRFDYTGTGDSSGDYPDWSMTRWATDIERAAEEVKRRGPSSRKAVVGLRVGASIALQVAGKSVDLDSLVLWDPIVSGSAYVDELRAGHENMMGYAHVIPKPEAGTPPEVLGFPFPDSLANEIGFIDLLTTEKKVARRTLVIESNDAVAQRPLCDVLSRAGSLVAHQEFSNPHLWVWTEDFAKMHVPRRILQAIVDWFTEEYA